MDFMSKDIDAFIEYCGITATGRTLYKIKNKIEKVSNFYKGKLDNLKLEDLHRFLSDLNKRDFAPSTKNDTIKAFKRFLKWKYKDWNTRFDELKDFKTDSNDQRKLDKSDLLTPDEMRIIFGGEENIKYKTLLLLFQETACRPEEILKLKWKDIDVKKEEIKLHSSKTDKTRYIPVRDTIPHLKRYKEECFVETPKANDRVFEISASALQSHLDYLEKKLKFSKHLYPYLWRHTVLSKMIRKLSPKVYENFAGHSLETGMKIYAHLDTDDLKDELKQKIWKIEEITEERTKVIDKIIKDVQEMKEKIAQIQAGNYNVNAKTN